MTAENIAERAEALCAAVGVFAFGVAVGITAFGLHGGAPTCETVAGQPIGEFCSRWVWGERMAIRAVQVSVLSFAVGMIAARHETVREWAQKVRTDA
jgi:hypothetical protein